VAELRWTAEAERWLEEIHDFIALDNPEAAGRTVAGIYEKAEELRDFPGIGYGFEGRAGRAVRIVLYGHYRIAYHLKDEAIEILGVFHGALDLERLL
jgi:plasmid stabilization system protein ParE